MHYSIPDGFAARLADAFRGNVRARWSAARNRLQIEQQVARGHVLKPRRLSREDKYEHDDLIRHADGYHLVMEVTIGSWAPCLFCGSDLAAPPYSFETVTCERCVADGRDGRASLGCFPPGDVLIDEIRARHPDFGGYERFSPEAVREHNTDMTRRKAAAVADAAQQGALDDLVFALPKVGYGSRITAESSRT